MEFLLLILLVLVVLKLCAIVAISWMWVFLPLYLYIGGYASFWIGAGLIFSGLVKYFTSPKKYKRKDPFDI